MACQKTKTEAGHGKVPALLASPPALSSRPSAASSAAPTTGGSSATGSPPKRRQPSLYTAILGGYRYGKESTAHSTETDHSVHRMPITQSTHADHPGR